jgi:pimeloyl-ACP methyl ester carboxylesterase
MPVLGIGPRDGLYYEHQPPTAAGRTFVFFNALTADTAMWERVVAPLRDAGHGTLSFDYRGQAQSPFSPDIALSPDLIVGDARRLLAETAPVRPVLVGLSIGGLFATRCRLAGTPADALVLINTLRRDGPRLRWINDALVRCVEVGGLALFRDMFLPLLFGEKWLAENRDSFLGDAPYQSLDPESGHHNLLRHAALADWDLPYAALDLPVLVLTGLQDRVFLDPVVVAELCARLPDGRRVDLPDVGHLVPAEAPDALAAALIDFAERL